MPKRKKEKLQEQLEKTLDKTVLEALKKQGKKGTVAGTAILTLQGGAIAITGSNLGICMLLTTGLSSVSSLLGITFPFAAYTSAAIVGGKIIAIGHILANPYIIAAVIAMGLYGIYKKAENKPYINLAGINYIIESKKRLGI
jgi:hypothetical protein